jgi:type I restriction enzyme S subunit
MRFRCSSPFGHPPCYKIIAHIYILGKLAVIVCQLNDNLEAQAQAFYKSFFVDYAETDGEMPQDWKTVTLADIAEDIVCGKTPPTSDECNYGGDVPFITIPDMHGQVYTTQTERFLSAKGVATQPNKTLPHNSICVSCIATAGLVCLTAKNSHTNQQINSIICKKGISAFYVYLKMTAMAEHIKRIGAGGSTTCNVNKTLFSQIEILLPDKIILARFHKEVKPLFSSIRANQYELQTLEKTKNLLLARIAS